jgi:hypothetical protein
MLRALARPCLARRVACLRIARGYSSSVDYGRASSVGFITSRNLCKVNEDTYVVSEVDAGAGQVGLLAAVFDGHGVLPGNGMRYPLHNHCQPL